MASELATAGPAAGKDGGRWPSYAIEIIWTLFAAANLAAMFLYPSWETVPFHLIWASFALLYGLRAWGLRSTVFALVLVGAATGALITAEGLRSHTFPVRAVEAPLMAAVLAALVWHVRRYLAALRTVREVSEANRALLERERRFVQNASHELRTPITVALGHAELLARSHRGGDDAEDIAVIVDELSHLRRLARQLLSLATLDEPDTLDIGRVEVATLLRGMLRRWSAIDRRWVLGPVEVASVPGDIIRLRTALDALIDNAVQQTVPGDQVELSAAGSGGRCALTVTDSGPGIPSDILDHVFDRFTRANTERADHDDGSGLGLSVVKAIAEAHGGSACAASRPGRTSVTILLPVTSAPGAIRLPGGVPDVPAPPCADLLDPVKP